MTKEQAIKLSESKFWKDMSYEERAKFQFSQEFLCMPFNIFHEAVEKTLKRPVFSHEFAFDGLKKELYGECDPPTFEEIIDLIPEDKRIIFLEK